MEYNTNRNNIIIPEYGRNIQKLVEYTINNIKNKKKIINNFYYILKVIRKINPNFKKNILNLKNNLWYKLFLITNIKLNNNLPFYKKKIILKKKKIKYPKNIIKYKYYGKIILKIINKLLIYKKKIFFKYLIYKLANIMKYNYIKWNNLINIDDKIIFNDIKNITNGKINLLKNLKPLKTINNNIITKKKFFFNKKKNYFNKKKLFLSKK
ncbi:MAG: DUF4290 domain-containing protein [Candidatus Shikimatogenerans sp. JK-2022]|nr:DUF4290 domain-containing protein [Candidatus Shikimatogenerans bostrichidophilus]